MKFFKYLIFTLLLVLSKTSYSDWQGTGAYTNGVTQFQTLEKWCEAIRANRPNVASCRYTGSDTNKTISARYSSGSEWFSFDVTFVSSCPSTVTSTPISVPGWTSWGIDQIDSYSAQISGKTACYQGCKYKNPTMSGSEGSDMMNLVYGDGVKDSSCPAGDSTKPSTPTPNNTGPTQMKPEECKSPTGSDGYCNKPSNKQCPSGYKQGSFNNQQICIKPSPDPDPTKPNPNDPNNGKGEGSCNGTNNCNTTNFDDSNIINAINNAVSSITSSISSINQSITSVANAVNATTNAVNNTTSAVNAVKSSVDALHNTINAVTSAVDNNTKAVNANGDKVTKAVNDNTTATNAVKTAVDGLNSSVKAVSDAVNANGKNTVDAVNANGKNTVDAVNAGTQATKENGKKLDGIQSSVDEGNGLIKDIKDWLTKEPTLENGQLEINNEVLPGYERKDYVQFTNTCPFSPEEVNLPMGVLGSITFTKDLTFICSYGTDARPYIIALGYFGALIYLLYGLRSRNG